MSNDLQSFDSNMPITLDTTFTSYRIPLSAIAQWPSQNLVNPVTRNWLVPYAFCLQILTTLVFVGRIWARATKQAGRFGSDDGLIIVSWAFGVLFTAMAIYGVNNAGFDKHIWDVPQSSVVSSGFVAWSAEILFLVSTGVTKISILLFYRRLVERSYSRVMQLVIYTALCFTAGYLLLFVSFLIFSCSPMNASWKSLDITYRKSYTCLPRRDADPIAGLFSVISDIYAMIIPGLVLKRLNMPKKQKIMLQLIFNCGWIVIAAGSARTYWLFQLHRSKNRDLTWIGYEIFVWSLLELQLAIICASAPALKGFFTNRMKTSISKVDSKAANKGSGYSSQSISWPLRSPMMWTAKDVKVGQITVVERFSVSSVKEPQKRKLGGI